MEDINKLFKVKVLATIENLMRVKMHVTLYYTNSTYHYLSPELYHPFTFVRLFKVAYHQDRCI